MREDLHAYLHQYRPSFWKVEEDVIAWSVIDKTIILREEFYLFAQIFEKHGFPDVELLFLFLGSLTDESKLVIHFANAALDEEVLNKILGDYWQRDYLERAHHWNGRVKEVNGVRNWKMTLCEMLLAAQPSEGVHLSRPLDHDFLDRMWELGMESGGEHPLGVKARTRSFALALGRFLKIPITVTLRDIETFQKTGVAQLVETEVEDKQKTLLEMLEEGDEESQMVAALTKLFLPSFGVSGRMHRPQDLPLGGFSDLSNKGTLDRLLVSELAHDPLTMAVRVVNGEALYLRRESPNVRQVPRRHLLLDNGIRLWGIGRVMVTAVGLALIRAGESDFPFSVMAPNEESVEEHDFGDRQGVVDFMSTLTCQSNLISQIDAFFEAHVDGLVGTELYVITSDRTASDQTLRLLLAGYSRRIPFQVITVSESGEVYVYIWNKGSMRECKHLEVDLDEVRGRCLPVSGQDKPSSKLVPVILKRKEFPMRFAIQRSPQRMYWVDDLGALSVSKCGELYLLQKESKGAELVGKGVPKGALVFGGYDSVQNLYVGVLSTNNMSRLYVSNSEGMANTYSFDKFGSMHDGQVTVAGLTDSGHLMIVGKSYMCIYNLDGEWLAGNSVGGIDEIVGGCIRSAEGWKKVRLENGQIHLESSPAPRGLVSPDSHRFYQKCEQVSYSGTTLVKHFSRVDLTSSGQLMLISPKGTTWQVCVLASGELAMRKIDYKPLYPDQVKRFSDTKSEGGVDFGVAVLENGSEIWLDPRGYVHLMPADSLEGELSFLTRPGHLCAWHSQHGYCGIHYFKNDIECSFSEMSQAWEAVLMAMTKK